MTFPKILKFSMLFFFYIAFFSLLDERTKCLRIFYIQKKNSTWKQEFILPTLYVDII